MSGKVSGQVWDLDMRRIVEEAQERGKLPVDAKLEIQPLRTVLLALADHADHNGRSVFPGVDLVVWKTELSERRVRAILSILRTLGILVPVRYLKGGRGHPTEYRLEFRNAPHKIPLPEKPDPPESLPTKPVADDRLSSGKGAASKTKGAASDLKGAVETGKGAVLDVKPAAIDLKAATLTGLTVRELTVIETSGEPARACAREAPENGADVETKKDERDDGACCPIGRASAGQFHNKSCPGQVAALSAIECGANPSG